VRSRKIVYHRCQRCGAEGSAAARRTAAKRVSSISPSFAPIPIAPEPRSRLETRTRVSLSREIGLGDSKGALLSVRFE